MIDFSANINPLGHPPILKDKLALELDNLIHYPDAHGNLLKDELSKAHNVSSSQLIIGNGVSEIIDLVVMSKALEKNAFSALTITPTFSEYSRAVKAYGGSSYHLEYININDNYLKIIEYIKKDEPDLVFLCSPNNPTGELINAEKLNCMIEACNQIKTTVIVDHSFLPFVKKEWKKIDKDLEQLNAVFLYSLTKIYATPGLRTGYALSSTSITKQIEKLRNQWSINYLAQVAIKECLKLGGFEDKTRKLVSCEREKLLTGLIKLGFKPFNSTANFILVDSSTKGLSGTYLFNELAKKGIFIRPCTNFDGLGEYFFRIAVRLPRENEQLLEELKCICS
ncbi:pyridoxal phosphate-dependent aminotransferase [Natranaerobius trueperi]|uniref:pyridoxal phosphate-dependent aminotransferase n=1 Tax=Natranaerobius trueperi TaxID=759412 RepID=UPI0013036153|nr:histidinol-phosphate transaminase [Natranaerobius trueperi]